MPVMADRNDDELPMIDLAATEGWVVDDSDEDDPVLLMPAVSYTHLRAHET